MNTIKKNKDSLESKLKTAKELYKEKNKDKLGEPPKPRYKYKIKNKSPKQYWMAGLTALFSVIIWFVLFFMFRTGQVKLLWLIIYTLIGIPIFLFANVVILIKLYLDRRRISGAITKSVSTNYIIANFVLENKRKLPVVCKINKDGRSFDYNDGLYLLDQDKIIWNEKNQPEGYWIYDDPEQKDIFELFVGAGDDDKRLYSSQNLKKFQKDKFMAELHRDKNEIDNTVILISMVVGFIILVVIMIFMRKPA